MSEFRWEETNDALRHRGLDPIAMSASLGLTFHDAVSTTNVESDDAGEKDSKDVVVMEKKSLAAIQETLHRLMDDCDRRQVVGAYCRKRDVDLMDDFVVVQL